MPFCEECYFGKFVSLQTGFCEFCPIASYAPEDHMPSCIDCPQGQVTLQEGSTSKDQCLSPLPNILLSILALVTLVFIAQVYIISSRFFRVGFLRRERIVLKLIKRLRDLSLVLAIQTKENYEYDEEIKKNQSDTVKSKSKIKSFMKVLLFVLILLIIIPVALGFQVYALIVTVLFKSLIIFKGFRTYINYSYTEKITSFINQIAVNIRFPSFVYLFTPMIQFFNSINLEVNLSAVNITCKGTVLPHDNSHYLN